MNALPGIGLLLVFTCLGLPDITKCQNTAKVSAVVCQNAGTECDNIDHADCGDTQKCKCNAGYKEDTNDGSTCVKIIGGSCSGTAACPGDANTVCKNSLCVCADDYVEKTNVCTKPRVSSIACPTGSECDNIDHSTCDTPTHKCKCGAGYVENSSDGDTCVQDSQQTKPQVSNVVCSTTGTECSAIPFAVCDKPTNLKCKCKDGYKKDSNSGSTCIKVLGTHCSGSSDCTGATYSACTNSKCTCTTGYSERDNVCKKLLNTVTCSANGKECDKLDHAECDGKGRCTCSAGFTMNVDLCTAKNSGTTLTMKLGIFVLPVLVAIHAVFKW
ncbi:cell death abnormality protein 1-like [Ruditapes philippinarum]|uniref:cell death abnormality protein 1-like n=1 Tax=Ruditapes philippinarum TaxID=129788 RepID=UPI00295BAE0D|nr:cell death abnormality protein 1-like [Ruditapes philippinarum]